MARLLHHFTPLFSYGLALDEKVSANQASEPAPSVIARARELIDRAKAAALADGKRPEQVDGARRIDQRHSCHLTIMFGEPAVKG